MKQLTLSFLVITMLLVGLATARADTAIIFGGDPTEEPSVFNQSAGWQFTVISDIIVTNLGFYDTGPDGLVNSHPVGIWNNSGQLIVQAVVPAGTSAGREGSFRYVVVPDTTLLAGNTYVIGSLFYATGDDFYNGADSAGSLGINPNISSVHSRNGFFGAGLGFPPNVGGPFAIFGPNFQFTTACRVDVTQKFYQAPPISPNEPCPLSPAQLADAPWACDFYANSTDRIRAKGCTLTVLAMALRFAGTTTIPGTGKDLNPGSLNQYMLSHSGYDGNNNVRLDYTARLVSGANKLKLHFDTPFSPSSPEALDEMLCKGYPVIVLVQGATHPHYVLVTGKQGDTFTIIDPGSRSTKLLSAYQNHFQIRGYVADPPGDISGLNADVGSNAEILVIDDQGRRTGFDGASGTVLKEVPRSIHFIDAIADDETGASAESISHSALIYQPTPGLYRIVVTGLRSGAYTLSVRCFSQDGTVQRPVEIQGQILPTEAQVFLVNISTTNGGQTTVTMLGARSMKRDGLKDLRLLRASLGRGRDAEEIEDAIQHLTKALKPKLWRDENHLDRDDGDEVFEEEEEAVEELNDLLQSKRNRVPDSVLQEFIERLVSCDRLLASVAIQDAIASGKHKDVKKAQDDFADGEEDAAEGRWEAAIKNYADAWEHATDAVSRHR